MRFFQRRVVAPAERGKVDGLEEGTSITVTTDDIQTGVGVVRKVWGKLFSGGEKQECQKI
jgi:hypothetical protein